MDDKEKTLSIKQREQLIFYIIYKEKDHVKENINEPKIKKNMAQTEGCLFS